jgi:hypothetical protein
MKKLKFTKNDLEKIIEQIEELPVYIVDTKDDITHWPRPKHSIEKYKVIKIIKSFLYEYL